MLDSCTNDNGNLAFCCQDDGTCDCESGDNTLPIDTAPLSSSPNTTLPDEPFVTSSTTSSTTSTTQIIYSGSTSTPLTTTPSESSGTNPESTRQRQTESTIPPTPQTSSPAPKGNNLGTAIGAGVGVPLGVIALAVTAYLLRRDRHSKRHIQEMRQSNDSLIGVSNGIEEPVRSSGLMDDQPEWTGRQGG